MKGLKKTSTTVCECEESGRECIREASWGGNEQSRTANLLESPHTWTNFDITSATKEDIVTFFPNLHRYLEAGYFDDTWKVPLHVWERLLSFDDNPETHYPCPVHKNDPLIHSCEVCRKLLTESLRWTKQDDDGLLHFGPYDFENVNDFISIYYYHLLVNRKRNQSIYQEILSLLEEYSDISDKVKNLLLLSYIKFLNENRPVFSYRAHRISIDFKSSLKTGKYGHGYDSDGSFVVQGYVMQEPLPYQEYYRLLDKNCKEIRTNLYFLAFRVKCFAWTEQRGPGEFVLVDAPAGLGKSDSIVRAFSFNEDISAVVFLPTIELCKQIQWQLIESVCNKKGWRTTLLELMTQKILENAGLKQNRGSKNQSHSQYGESEFRSVVEKEVFFYKGINEQNCINYKKIVRIYSSNVFDKSPICNQCEKRNDCEVLKQREKLQSARIILTTHAQYNSFYNDESRRYWKNKKNNSLRDYFIIDENHLIQSCFAPGELNFEQFIQLSSDFKKFCAESDNISELGNYKALEPFEFLIDAALKELLHGSITSLVSGVDAEFRIPYGLKDEWNSDYVNSIETRSYPNLIDFLEYAVQVGCVVDHYKKRVFLPNPTRYDLRDMPTHVMFDGTPMDIEYIQAKLDTKRNHVLKLEVPPLGRLSLYQNENSDLPKHSIELDKLKILQYVERVIKKNGTGCEYLFLCNKDVERGFLREYLESKAKSVGLKFHVRYFGNLRGINEAKGCDICVVLGSYIVPDAVEVCYALPLLGHKLPKRQVIPITNHLYKWQNGRKVYVDEYDSLNRISKWIRATEHKQGMARTRHINHDVVFYVISKDPVEEYEDFSSVEDDELSQDLWSSKKAIRSDSGYFEVREAAEETMAKSGYVTTALVSVNLASRNSKLKRRQTIASHLAEVAKELEWERKGNKYHSP